MTSRTLLVSDRIAATKHGAAVTLTAAGSLITLTLPEIENVYRFALSAAHLRRYAAPPTDEPNWTG
jgi:hypothetical protein